MNTPLTAEEAKKLGSIHKGSISFGHLTLSYSLDTQIPQLIADATIYNVSIGHIVIDPQNPTGTIGGKVGFVDAEVKLTADFNLKEIDYDAKVVVFNLPVINKKGKLFTW